MSSNMGVTGLLGVLFVGLKLTGYVKWSWWWVLSPFWGPVALLAGFLLAIFGAVMLRELRKTLGAKQPRRR